MSNYKQNKMIKSYSSKKDLDSYIHSLDTYYSNKYNTPLKPSRNQVQLGEVLKSYTFVNLPSLEMNPVPVILVDE